MRRRGLVLFVILAAGLSVVGREAQAATATLTLTFADASSFVGRAFGLRVVDATTFAEVARLVVPEVQASPFDLDLDEIEIGRTFRVDAFVDLNGNGRYDAPPVDQAWRFVVGPVLGSGRIDVPSNGPLVDIDWPPSLDGRIDEGEYRHSLTDAATGITVSWQNDNDVLFVGLSARATGWLSIGFDPTARMQGADFVLASVVNGALTLEDHYGIGQTTHRRDEASHVIQAAGTESDGSTVVEFAMLLASGDPADASLVPGQTVTILLALHATQDAFTSRHTARSTRTIVLDGGR